VAVDDAGKSNLSEAFADISASIILVHNDPLDQPAIKQSEFEPAIKLLDTF
jgi:hypothetical protein